MGSRPPSASALGPRLLVVDNYDSFTWNLVGQLRALGAEVQVLRHDARGLVAAAHRAQGVLISPGPGTPEQAGQSPAIVERCLERGIPLLGVCLGHQLLAQVLGGRVVRAPRPMHGKTSLLRHTATGLFQHWPARASVMRYHSLVVSARHLPASLSPIAHSRADGSIMAVAHRTLPAWGVQFHPESILTTHGPLLLANWLAHVRAAGV